MKPLTINSIKKEKIKRLIFDLDGVIAIHPKDGINYVSKSKPDTALVNLMREAKKKGHTIIISTARKMRSHGNNIGAVVADTAYETIKWLKKYKIPYDELYFGKPYGHVYFDDLALNYRREEMLHKMIEIIDGN